MRASLFLLLFLFLGSFSFGAAIFPPEFLGSVNMNSHSHGGGYNPYYNEFWMPQWAGSTVYRYDRSYQSLGSFNTGQSEVMQIWGDTDGSYYTANWGYFTITKKKSLTDNTTLWTYNMPTNHSAAVAADSTYVYAASWTGASTIYKINKTTGSLVTTLSLSGGDNWNSYGSSYGGLAIVDNYLVMGTPGGRLDYYDKNTGGARLYTYSTGYNIYGSSYVDGVYYIHQNDGTQEMFRLANSVSVPEPSSIMLLFCVVLFICGRNKF